MLLFFPKMRWILYEIMIFPLIAGCNGIIKFRRIHFKLFLKKGPPKMVTFL